MKKTLAILGILILLGTSMAFAATPTTYSGSTPGTFGWKIKLFIQGIQESFSPASKVTHDKEKMDDLQVAIAKNDVNAAAAVIEVVSTSGSSQLSTQAQQETTGAFKLTEKQLNQIKDHLNSIAAGNDQVQDGKYLIYVSNLDGTLTTIQMNIANKKIDSLTMKEGYISYQGYDGVLKLTQAEITNIETADMIYIARLAMRMVYLNGANTQGNIKPVQSSGGAACTSANEKDCLAQVKPYKIPQPNDAAQKPYYQDFNKNLYYKKLATTSAQ